MSNPAFPTLTGTFKLPDSKQFGLELEDPAQKTDIEGGYVITRPKHTRIPRKTWTGISYVQLNSTDKAALESFWNTVKGGSLIFDWTNPEDGSLYLVRFKDPVKFKYAGIGQTHYWDCSFSLQQA